jgi:hypothetical protein
VSSVFIPIWILAVIASFATAAFEVVMTLAVVAPVLVVLAVAALLAVAVAVALAIPSAFAALLFGNYIYYGLVGFMMEGLDWTDIFTDSDKLMQAFLRGASLPIHVAYNNVLDIYKEKLHILDAD